MMQGQGHPEEYVDYSLLMAARQRGQGDHVGHSSTMGGLSNAKPIHEEDRDEFALGVTLVHYSMNTGIKKFKAKDNAGVTKEPTQMHNMNMFY